MKDNTVGDLSENLCGQFFRNPNEEERLPLSQEESDLATFIHPIVDEVLQNHSKNASIFRTGPNPNSIFQNLTFQERIEFARDKLKVIILTFSETDACKTFVDIFPTFETHRASNIEKLRELAEDIKKDRKNSNISQVTGSSFGALGCAVIVSALVFPPAGFVLGIVGGSIAGVGSAVSIGTTITESILLKKKMNTAKKLLEADKEEMKKIEEWITHSIEFLAAVQAIFSINLMKSLSESMHRLVRDAPDFEASLRRSLDEFMKKFRKKVDVSNQMAPFYSITITTLSVLFLLRKQKHCFYDATVLTSDLFFAFSNGLEMSVEVTRIIAQIIMRGGVEAVGKLPANVARIVFHGVFAGVGMALDIINIIYASVDLSRGSESKQAKDIIEAADIQEKELNVLREIHSSVRNTIAVPLRALGCNRAPVD